MDHIDRTPEEANAGERRGGVPNRRKTDDARREKRERFLLLFAEHGNFTRAAHAAGLNRTALYRYINENPEFEKRYKEAEAVAALALRDEALRRAVEGVTKPVFYKGSVCGEVREFSTVLLLTLLKARFPEFRDKKEVTIPGDVRLNLPSVIVKVVDPVREK